MEFLELNIIEPTIAKSEAPIYFDGKSTLVVKDRANRIGLKEKDEYVLIATLGSGIFLSKKIKGDGKFGFRFRNRNSKIVTYYCTTKELRTKVGFKKGHYTLGEAFEQDNRIWFKVETT